MSEAKVVVVAQVEQEFEAVSAVAALKDAGIAAYYKPTATNTVLGLPGALGCPDSFDIFIPEEAAEQSKDVLISIGCISEDTAENVEVPADKNEKDAPQTLNDLMPDNPVLATVYKIVFAVMALVFIGAFVWLSDIVIAWFLRLFS